MIYGAKANAPSKEDKNEGGELFKKFEAVYQKIDGILKGFQSKPLPYLNYDFDSLWNFSWGISQFFDGDRQKLYHSGSLADLKENRPVFLLLNGRV